MNCNLNFSVFLSSPQIMVKWPSFLPADTNSRSASSCPRRRWSPPSRGNTAASVTGSKWSSTGRGPPSRRSRKSLQSSSPLTSTHRPYWWASQPSWFMIVLPHTSWFSGCFEVPHLVPSFSGATGWNQGQDGEGMVPQLWTGVCYCKDRPQRLHTR